MATQRETKYERKVERHGDRLCRYTVCIEGKKEKTKEAVYDEIMAWNFPELSNDKTLQIQEAK